MLYVHNVRVPNHRSWRPHPRAKADAVRVGVYIHSPVAKKADQHPAAFPREGGGEIGRR